MQLASLKKNYRPTDKEFLYNYDTDAFIEHNWFDSNHGCICHKRS